MTSFPNSKMFHNVKISRERHTGHMFDAPIPTVGRLLWNGLFMYDHD